MKRLSVIYIAGAVVLIIFGLLVWLFIRSGTSSVNQNRVSNVPAYQLSSEEETQLQSFVKTFAQLYNTYSTGDYSNLYALGDYQTTDMQYRTKAVIDQLDQQTPSNYDIVSKPVDGSFHYLFSRANTITASIVVNVTESVAGTSKTYQDAVNLIIIKNGFRYFVDSVTYSKK